MNFSVLKLFVVLSVIPECVTDFHPLYQAMLGDPTIRIHYLTYASMESTKRNLTSFFVYPNFPGPFHAVIIAPDADGRNSFEDSKAVALARQGYAALAADMKFVGDSEGHSDSESDARTGLLHQYLSAYQEIKKLPFVNKVASIGYGLGGLTVLDAVRLKAVNITAAVCVHAILRPLNETTLQVGAPNENIGTKTLIVQGWKDPLNPRETVDEILQELDQLEVDWQLHTFGRAKHAFSIPVADVDNITQYSADAAQQGWLEILLFLESSLRQ